ncbi:MAG: hypothetical protein R3180_00235 [Marinobacter sp.]|nr:hypothetical protein [Marinobacter sp.]
MAQKIDVIYTRRVEDFAPKTGKKIIVPKGTEASLTPEEYARVKHAVRVCKPAKPAGEKATAE